MVPAMAIDAAAKAMALADGWTRLDWDTAQPSATKRFFDLARTALGAASPYMK